MFKPDSTPADDTTIADGISFEEYLRVFAHQHAEWKGGSVVAMSPISQQHDALVRVIENMLETCIALTGGRVLSELMVMKLPALQRGREPDVMVLLPDSLARLQDTYVDGAADLVVEVVSPESTSRDRGEKFYEYEAGGVREYWLIDPLRRDALFYVRNADGWFEHHAPDADGVYHSAILPRFRLRVALLWQEPPLNILQVTQSRNPHRTQADSPNRNADEDALWEFENQPSSSPNHFRESQLV